MRAINSPPEGRIYIASAFKEITPPLSKNDWRDNDPHFWTQPPTWGICRWDFRNQMRPGDWVFFVLPADAERNLPQMIFAYIKIKDIFSHLTAYNRVDLDSKKMGNKFPRGNIICDANFKYNRFDLGEHKLHFSDIKNHYAIGDPAESEFLAEEKIRRLGLQFLDVLNRIYDKDRKSVFGVIGRRGRILNQEQSQMLINWLRS